MSGSLSATNVAARKVLGLFLETEDAKRLAKYLSLCTIELLRKKDSSKIPFRFGVVQNLFPSKRLNVTIILMQLANCALQR